MTSMIGSDKAEYVGSILERQLIKPSCVRYHFQTYVTSFIKGSAILIWRPIGVREHKECIMIIRTFPTEYT